MSQEKKNKPLTAVDFIRNEGVFTNETNPGKEITRLVGLAKERDLSFGSISQTYYNVLREKNPGHPSKKSVEKTTTLVPARTENDSAITDFVMAAGDFSAKTTLIDGTAKILKMAKDAELPLEIVSATYQRIWQEKKQKRNKPKKTSPLAKKSKPKKTKRIQQAKQTPAVTITAVDFARRNILFNEGVGPTKECQRLLLEAKTQSLTFTPTALRLAYYTVKNERSSFAQPPRATTVTAVLIKQPKQEPKREASQKLVHSKPGPESFAVLSQQPEQQPVLVKNQEPETSPAQAKEVIPQGHIEIAIDEIRAFVNSITSALEEARAQLTEKEVKLKETEGKLESALVENKELTEELAETKRELTEAVRKIKKLVEDLAGYMTLIDRATDPFRPIDTQLPEPTKKEIVVPNEFPSRSSFENNTTIAYEKNFVKEYNSLRDDNKKNQIIKALNLFATQGPQNGSLQSKKVKDPNWKESDFFVRASDKVRLFWKREYKAGTEIETKIIVFQKIVLRKNTGWVG